MPPPSTTTKQLDRIEAAILGNGHEGLLARTARIEEKTISIDEKVDAASELAKEAKLAAQAMAQVANEEIAKTSRSISDLAVIVAKLDVAVEQHHGTEHLSKLIKKKEFWVIIVVGFIALHMLSTYVPNIWDWIAALLGIPKLVPPLG